jgi:glyoxylase-like metal-dependent hydrolase (beta-lactamase superfamily II)
MRISERCYALTGLGYLTPWSVNAGFIVGSETTLIVDTGACALSAATIHGYASAARAGNRLAVINTEPHFDHIGGNSYFRDRGIDVHGHVKIQRTEDQFRAEVDGFNEAIGNPARRAGGDAGAFYSGTRLENPNCPIASETSLDLGGCTVEIVFTPGHTPANLSVWAPSDGVLFCGDCLIGGYLPNLDAGGVPEWQEWLRSLHRIQRLMPSAVIPGHGPVATGAEVAPMIASGRSVLEQAIVNGCSPTSQRAAAG